MRELIDDHVARHRMTPITNKKVVINPIANTHRTMIATNSLSLSDLIRGVQDGVADLNNSAAILQPPRWTLGSSPRVPNESVIDALQ
ncbi:MAG: hypothetical protein E6Q98_23800 [Rhodospirillaceae bacterium]|nr:MAG: hypothetical protein E6Q98_23800 [Rhodospirillaceae bacterium]